MSYINYTTHIVHGTKKTLEEINGIITSFPLNDEEFDGDKFLETIKRKESRISSPSASIYDLSLNENTLEFSVDSKEYSNFSKEITSKFPDTMVEWKLFDEMIFYNDDDPDMANNQGTDYGIIYKENLCRQSTPTKATKKKN